MKQEAAELNSFCNAGKARFEKMMKSLLHSQTARITEALKKETAGDISKLTSEKIKTVSIERSTPTELLSLSESMLSGSLLLGYYHAMPESVKTEFADDEFTVGTSFNIPFEEAVDFLKSKISMTKDEWNELERKLQFRAFTVAALNDADMIEAVRGRLAYAVEKGETVWQSWHDIKAMTEDWGERFSPNYWETVYRTNVQSAYNAGRLMQYQNNEPKAWELLFIEDGRTSNVCRGLSGIVGGKTLSSKHSFWDTYGFPPYHFNCRTTFRAVYDDETEVETPRVNPPMKEIRRHFKPQTGFGGNPIEKESWWKLTPQMIARAQRYNITADIVAQANEFDMQSYFPELLKGYKTEYKGKKGGYVQTALNAEHNLEEIASAKRLADLGHKVYLLPKNDVTKSPDMLIDNEIGEIKHCSSLNSIDQQLRKSIHQGSRITCLDISGNLNIKQIRKTIDDRRKRTENKLKKVIVFFNGNVFKF